MKNILKTLLVLGVVSFGVNPLFAGAGHDHSHGGHGHSHDKPQKQASKEKILKASKQRVNQLIKAEKIDASWQENTLLTAGQKKFGANLEWVVSYQNMKVKDPKKQTLYIFVDLYGKVKAANYTGK